MFNYAKLLSGLLIVLGGWVYYVMQNQQSQIADGEQWLLPQLQNDHLIAEIDRVELSGGAVNFYLNKKSGVWYVNNEFYANMEPLMGLVQSLQNAKKKEAKTNNPQNFSRLQIDDHQRTIKVFAGSRRLVGIHIGKAGHAIDTVFVRMIGDLQSWLVSDFKPLPYDMSHWQLKTVLNLGQNQIAALNIKHRNGEVLNFEKSQKTQQLALNNSVGEEIKTSDEALNLLASLTSALSHFSIEQAKPKTLSDEHLKIELEYQLNNGENLLIKLFQTPDGSNWAVIDNEQYRNWQLQIAAFKYNIFNKRPADFLSGESSEQP